MPEIRIRRLHLRIRRRGGWAASGDHHALAERVRRMVLAELEPLLLALFAGGEAPAAAASAPAGVTVDLRLTEAAARMAGPEARAGLRAQLARGLRSAPRAGPPATDAEPAPGLAAPGPSLAPAPRAAPAAAAMTSPPAPPGVIGTLLRWRAEGTLEGRLALLDAPAGARWLAAALADLEARPVLPPGGGFVAGAPQPPVAMAQAGPPAAPRQAAGATLAALLDLAAHNAPWRPPEEALRPIRGALREAAMPEPPARPAARGPGPGLRPEPPAAAADAGGAAATPRPGPHAAPAAPPLAARPCGLPERAAVETALPLLVAGPLDRIGWLEAVGIALRAAGQADHAPALGFALALKALPPPARGWRHPPGMLQAATLAAGLAEPPPGAALAAAARALAPHLRAADAVLADALLRGHAEHAPLGLVATRGGVLALLEPEGLFPIALGEGWDAIAPLVPPGAPVLAGATVPPATLRAIAEGGACFAAPGPAARGERWRMLQGPGGWWGTTNAAADAAPPRLGRAAAAWTAREAQAVAVVERLGADRPPAPGLSGHQLDRSVTLAAAVALGSLAWPLSLRDPVAWAEPDPLLALERFQDLSARLRISPGEVEVLLPLGPRSRDLRAAGLLHDVAGVPWLAPRRIRFGIA